MLRRRLNALQSHAHQVMNDTQGLVSNTDKRLGVLVEAALETLATAVELLEEVKDGVSGEIEIAGKVLPVQGALEPARGRREGVTAP